MDLLLVYIDKYSEVNRLKNQDFTCRKFAG